MMKVASFDAVVRVLNEAGVRFIVVGGLAVIAHGYLRSTKDIDIVIKLTPDHVRNAFAALASIDYHPAVPITAEQFADERMRENWRKEKAMLVLKMWSDRHRETPLDIFVYEPFNFDAEYERALVLDETGGVGARFVAIPALISMKMEASREHDLIDVEFLRKIEKLGET